MMTKAKSVPLDSVYSKVVARAWSDPSFKARLVVDPRAALAEMGVAVPAGIRLKALEDTEDLVHLVVPLPPTGELSGEDLRMVAGGLPAVQLHRGST